MARFDVTMTLYSANHVALMLLGLVACNVESLLANPHLPDLYSAKVRYREEPRGQNRWQGILETYARGYGDCEDLAAARAAICQVRLRDPKAHCVVKHTHTPGLWHVIVQRGDGSYEDPSRVLGMDQYFQGKRGFHA